MRHNKMPTIMIGTNKSDIKNAHYTVLNTPQLFCIHQHIKEHVHN